MPMDMQGRYLRTGIFLAPFHALGENPTLAIERDMELVEHLDRLNYHEAWIGEHHSGGFEIIACPEMFLAAAAQRTRNIRLGTGDRKSTRLNSSHTDISRMPSSA